MKFVFGFWLGLGFSATLFGQTPGEIRQLELARDDFNAIHSGEPGSAEGIFESFHREILADSKVSTTYPLNPLR